MPGLARKLIICAAIDGLIVQPLSSKGQKPFQPVKIKYGDASISNIPRAQAPELKPEASFEAFGIIGLVTVSRLSFLITITRRQQVAQILGHPIYVVTEVAITPCSTRGDAEESIKRTSLHLKRRAPHSLSEDEESSEEEEVHQRAVVEADDAIDDDRDDAKSDSARSSIAEDVIRKRGSYGRFAQRWFSRSGWTIDQQRTMGMSVSPTVLATSTIASSLAPSHSGQADEARQSVSSLLPKLLRTLQVLFGTSRSFYFSYDIDVTRNLANKMDLPNDEVPLYAHVDSMFFWNRNILQPFMTTGQEALCLPIMQGFIGQRSFVMDSQPPQKDETAQESHELSTLSPTGSLPSSPPVEKAYEAAELRLSEKSYLLTLISRRSTKRGGLRYLRRGVDDNGFTANTVETEQILSPSNWNSQSRVYSFLQIRGSIPLFFTQTPFSMKPAPVLQHATEANYQACRKHFERLVGSYGEIQIVNLVEKHGIESPLGTQFERSITRMNEEVNAPKVDFEWFDFHRACRGMKFENVSILLLQLKDRIEEMGCTVQQDGGVQRRQIGVIRTNCMDCLDRTNVCQSSFARHMLDVHLKEEGFDVSAQLDQATTWFNTLWADNGDAVSKQYASTAAMKGDYTRTRKRDYRGALNDLGLSLTRFYNGMVNDYFSQATIDFLLGNVTATVFDEFEADMMTKDPAVSVIKLREQALELCQRRVIADEGEEYHGGWVLISPRTTDTVKSWPMEEVVLLLTDVALYLCRLDWESDKVSSFERVELSTLTHIKSGAYITSTMSPAHMDETKNVGFVVSYEPNKSHVKRTNTRTLSTQEDLEESSEGNNAKDASHAPTLIGLMSGRPKGPEIRKLAFKAPYTSSSTVLIGSGPQQTESQQIATICADIERLTLERQPQRGEAQESLIQKEDIISLEEAKRNTGLLEQLGHSIKRLVWA